MADEGKRVRRDTQRQWRLPSSGFVFAPHFEQDPEDWEETWHRRPPCLHPPSSIASDLSRANFTLPYERK